MAQAAQEKALRNRSVIVWGVILILGVLSALAVYSFLSAANKMVNIVVASQDIPSYTKITSEYVKTISIQADTYKTLTADGINVYKTAEEIDGFYSEMPIKAGEMFYKFKVADPKSGRYIAQVYDKPGWKMITLKVNSLNAGAAQLTAGDYVDIYYKDPVTKEIVANPKLRNIRIMDIKYGINYFQVNPKDSTSNSSSSSSSGSSSVNDTGSGSNTNSGSSTSSTAKASSSLGNMNPSLGDSAAIIIALPVDKAAVLVDGILNEAEIYVTGTTPLTFAAQLNDANSLSQVVTVNDFQLPTSDQVSLAATTPGMTLKVKIVPQEMNFDASSETSASPTADVSLVYENDINNVQFQVNGKAIDAAGFLIAYDALKGAYKINFIYTDNPDKNLVNNKLVTMINLATE